MVDQEPGRAGGLGYQVEVVEPEPALEPAVAVGVAQAGEGGVFFAKWL